MRFTIFVLGLSIAILANREGAKGAKEDWDEVYNFCRGCFYDFNLGSVVCSSFLAGSGFSRIFW
ncbi:MAG: hypothetical protein EAZ59_19790 [Oscillatoriales cyanobacterium]|nr:MAG: hypothetical protein EAZ59_19790 [Oscillatoriales cyanobacterium]